MNAQNILFHLQHDSMLDYVMIRLRTAEGIELGTFSNKYGKENARVLFDAI